MRFLTLCGLVVMLLWGCGSGSNSSPITEDPSGTGVLIKGSVNDERVPFAIMEWYTTDETFHREGVADNNGDWAVFVPVESLNPDQALIISANNPSNQRKIRSAVSTNDLLSTSKLYVSDLTTVSHFTEAAYQLLDFGDGYDSEQMRSMQDFIKIDNANNLAKTGGPMVDHIAFAVQQSFYSPDTSEPDVATERAPFWQVWSEENTATFRADCASCHQQEFCTGGTG